MGQQLMIKFDWKTKLCAVALFSSVISGCSTFGEQHYFASVNNQTGEIVNVFRLTVEGGSDLSNARYLSGYYDERAVDLFFNEIDSEDYAIDAGNLPGAKPIFKTCKSGETEEQCKTRVENSLTVSQLGSDSSKNENKSFVLILSTNADAISQTIGALAEDASIKQSLFRIANKDKLQEQAKLKAIEPFKTSQRLALSTELTTLIESAHTDTQSTKDDYLAVLSVLARGLSQDAPVRFRDWSEAKVWFANNSTQGVK